MRIAVAFLIAMPFAAQAESPVPSSFMLSGVSVWDTTGEPDVRAMAERDRLSTRGDGDFIMSDLQREPLDEVETGRGADRQIEAAAVATPRAAPRKAAQPVRAATSVKPKVKTRGLGPWQTGIYQ